MLAKGGGNGAHARGKSGNGKQPPMNENAEFGVLIPLRHAMRVQGFQRRLERQAMSPSQADASVIAASDINVKSCNDARVSLRGGHRLAFEPTLESLNAHRVPQWYEDAKFGIFIHWGLFSIPAFAARVGSISAAFREHL